MTTWHSRQEGGEATLSREIDQYRQREDLRFRLQLTRECFYETGRELMMNSRTADSLTVAIGNHLVMLRPRTPPRLFDEWVRLANDTSTGRMNDMALSADPHCPAHVVGIALIWASRQPDLWDQLASFDTRSQWQSQHWVEQYDQTIIVEFDITIPAVQVRFSPGDMFPIDQVRAVYSESLERQRTYIRADMEFSDFQVAGEQISQRIATGVREDDAAEALAVGLSALAEVEAAVKVTQEPQGTIAPRKTKRVCVATPQEGIKAESPRRLTIRRDRKN